MNTLKKGRNFRMKNKLLGFALACALLITLPARADIVWAVAGPMTGDVAMDGQSELVGIKQAVEDINTAGGIKGQKVVLKVYDDACDPKQAVAVANKIVSENIHYVLNETCSGASLAALKVYADEGVVDIHTLASNPKITDDGGPTIFRVIYRDDNLALVIANYIINHDAKKKLAILHDKSAFGVAIATYLKTAINKAGVKEITFESYDPVNHDYSTLVTHLKEIGSQSIFIAGYPVEEGLIARQLRAANSTAQIYGGYVATNDFWNVSGPAGDGTLFAFTQDPRKEPMAKAAIERIQKSGAVADGITLYSYAAAEILGQAIAKAGDKSSAVAEVMHKNTFNTILGAWKFDAKGDASTLRQIMYRWHDGKYAELGE